MASECFYGSLSEPHGAAALLGLGLSESEATAVVGACERPAYPHGLRVEVNIFPLEAEQLPAPHARVDGEHIEGFEAVSGFASRFEQPAGLFRRERVHLLRCGRRGLDRIGRVAGD